jgi:23S rRNA pseudouridine1911/1915/1917 synthase
MTGATTDAPRLDVWLAQQRNITRHAARTLLDAGLVTMNGRPARPGQRVRDHDVVVVLDVAHRVAAVGGTGGDGAENQTGGSGYAVGTPVGSRRSTLGSPSAPSPVRLASVTPRHHLSDPRLPRGGSAAATVPLTIVYEDEWLAVVDKPAGMVVHPAPGHASNTLADALKARGSTWSLLGGEERAGIVHRLDRDTSGLLVVAKTEAAHRGLAAQLRERTLGRTYWVIVHGGFREASGTVDAPIGRDPRNRKRMAVVDGGRPAITDFTVVERLGDATLLEVRLRTGRTHQVRVHMAYIKHPVVGDAVYGRLRDGLTRPALHATRLHLVHPIDGTPRTFDSPPPPELTTYLDALRERRDR